MYKKPITSAIGSHHKVLTLFVLKCLLMLVLKQQETLKLVYLIVYLII